MEKVRCPKCYGQAWYETDKRDVFLRCLCGMHKLVFTTLEDTMTIEHREIEEPVKLPKRNTRLYSTLAVLFALEPSKTDRVTEVLNVAYGEKQEVKDVASQLTVLRYRRLVEVVDKHKGKVGGSVWRLTDSARRLFGG